MIEQKIIQSLFSSKSTSTTTSTSRISNRYEPVKQQPNTLPDPSYQSLGQADKEPAVAWDPFKNPLIAPNSGAHDMLVGPNHPMFQPSPFAASSSSSSSSIPPDAKFDPTGPNLHPQPPNKKSKRQFFGEPNPDYDFPTPPF
eukprot:CAMPEP_0201552920 /NCGR_PEP_ID=MMETSP0173_2-20130828/19336_1 /ASSEMBLY_ACC=CAM_ASM_000268 /TAXON_ID=218659 /ORGANISM="Vexillifera sp., Strain DIVA3 564/2" /LENGTH=141 /DNA_ID=CAMNT_0047963507 /DNA_START=418 /DNA_END=843 /DNA_ORIENTATION=+